MFEAEFGHFSIPRTKNLPFFFPHVTGYLRVRYVLFAVSLGTELAILILTLKGTLRIPCAA
jgi:hypothetical protein